MNIANSARKLLIQMGKMLPFAICFIVFLAYSECLVAIIFERYLYFPDCCILNTPLSNFIGQYFEYDLLSVIVTLITSVSIEACTWNRLAVLYLALHLMFKIGVADMELSLTEVGIMSAVNVIISAFLVYKGIRMLNIC